MFNTEVVHVKSDEGGAFGAALFALTVDLRHKGDTVTLRDVCDEFVELDYDMRAAGRRLLRSIATSMKSFQNCATPVRVVSEKISNANRSFK